MRPRKLNSVRVAHKSAMARRIPINVLFGVPDDGKASIRIAPDRKSISYTLTGLNPILPFLSADRFDLNVLYFQADVQAPQGMGPGALLNHIADADICREALKLVRQVAARSNKPCFNHPAAIARTTRDEVARRLSGTPGLKVPKTIRIDAASPEQVRDAIEHEGVRYPALVRVAGSHGGKNMVFVMNAATVVAAAPLLDRERSLYVTEYCDFASPDGLYRKFRVAVVGDEIFPRTCITGRTWRLNRDSRLPNSTEEERSQLASFDRKWAPRLRPLFQEIARRLGLDFFGVDCNIDDEGNVLLFEANACMNILKDSFPPPNIWEGFISRIRAAVEDRLASPQTWRCHRLGQAILSA